MALCISINTPSAPYALYIYLESWSITNLGQEASLDEAVAATNGLIDWVLEQYMEWLERGGAAGLVGLQLNLKRS